VVRQGSVFAQARLLAGSPAAAAPAHVVSAMLVGVSPADPLVFAVASVLTARVALASAAIPSWRALRVAPAVALRWQ
jgi:putative ABC transport system permease protein